MPIIGSFGAGSGKGFGLGGVSGPAFIEATGGTIQESGDYKIHIFTGPGTFTVTNKGRSSGSDSVDYLVVAGGGSGGAADGGGAGGAGGYRASGYGPAPLQGSALPVSVQGYPITVGGGGASVSSPSSGNQGSPSIFSTITSTGGGKGGRAGGDPSAPLAGGSGGGSGQGTGANPGGAGNTPPVSPPQGNPGGQGVGPPLTYMAGGGGGAGAAGNDGDAPPIGAGGVGVPNVIYDSPTVGTPGPAPGRYYAGGGGGSSDDVSGGIGGAGGGGAGGCSGPGSPGDPGTANTGGGGGGAQSQGPVQTSGAGGSGIVIIRYKFQ